MEAETVAVCPHSKHYCLLRCMLKATVFGLVAVFVLYLPMGDPSNYSIKKAESRDQKWAECLCDLYFMTIKVANEIFEMTQVGVAAILGLLHEAKLKFYSILGKIDRHDLCRSVCGPEDTASIEIQKRLKHRICKCTKVCSMNKLDKA